MNTQDRWSHRGSYQSQEVTSKYTTLVVLLLLNIWEPQGEGQRVSLWRGGRGKSVGEISETNTGAVSGRQNELVG